MPAKRPDLSVIYEAPRNSTEAAVAKAWLQLLDIDRVGIHDHFFDLGGDSLFAAQASFSLSEYFGIQISLEYLFDHPTVAELAAGIAVFLDAASSQTNRADQG